MRKITRSFIILFLIPLIFSCTENKVESVYVQDGNTVVMYTDETTKQITYSSEDKTAFLFNDNKNAIVIRQSNSDSLKKILSIPIENPLEKVLAQDLKTIREIVISYDESYLYFLDLETDDMLLKRVNINSSESINLIPAFSFIYLNGGTFNNHLLVFSYEESEESETPIFYYNLHDSIGVLQKEFNTDSNARSFLSANYQDYLAEFDSKVEKLNSFIEMIESAIYYQELIDDLEMNQKRLQTTYNQELEELDRIKLFQFGRSEAQRDRQIAKQRQVIQNVDDEIKSIVDQVTEAKNKLMDLQERAMSELGLY